MCYSSAEKEVRDVDVRYEVSCHLQYVTVVFLQSVQVRGQSHFNELVDGRLQAPQCQLGAFLCHVSR